MCIIIFNFPLMGQHIGVTEFSPSFGTRVSPDLHVFKAPHFQIIFTMMAACLYVCINVCVLTITHFSEISHKIAFLFYVFWLYKNYFISLFVYTCLHIFNHFIIYFTGRSKSDFSRNLFKRNDLMLLLIWLIR